ncbi:MAG: AMP-binding protein, partial [Actinomycetota bacterium]
MKNIPPLLTERERHRIVVEWNDTAAPFPQACIHELFERQVRATPGAVALDCDGVELTYAELDVRSNQLAHHLRDLGVGPEVLVGI